MPPGVTGWSAIIAEIHSSNERRMLLWRWLQQLAGGINPGGLPSGTGNRGPDFSPLRFPSNSFLTSLGSPNALSYSTGVSTGDVVTTSHPPAEEEAHFVFTALGGTTVTTYDAPTPVTQPPVTAPPVVATTDTEP